MVIPFDYFEIIILGVLSGWISGLTIIITQRWLNKDAPIWILTILSACLMFGIGTLIFLFLIIFNSFF